MTNPLITILQGRDHPGGTSYRDVVTCLKEGRPIECLGEALHIEDAMATEWETDAHFVGYVATDAEGNEAPLRINKRKSRFVPELIQDGGKVLVRLLSFDHDLHDEGKREKRSWSGGELEEFVRELEEGSAPFTPTYWYSTKHGSRFVYVLSESVGPEEAEALARGMRRDFAAAGIEMDGACCDWTRLMRLPKTIRGDTETAWYKESSNFMYLQFGGMLDPSRVVPGERRETQAYSAVTMQFGEKPDESECHDLLYEPGKSGDKMTAWHKRAKKQLNGSDAYPACFEHVAIDDILLAKKGYGGRNEALLKMIGSMCGLLIAFDDTTEEHVYALMRETLEQLTVDCPEQEDWTETGWDLICRMWEGEVGQLAAKRQVRKEQEEKADKEKGEIIVQMRQSDREEIPTDEEEASLWLQQRMIASDGTLHRLMKGDGTYTINGVPSLILLAAIRDLGVDHLIRTHEFVGNTVKTRTAADVLTDHCIPITRTLATACEDTSYIQGPPGDRQLVMPIHQLDLTLEPEFNEDIDKWLQAFFGERYADGVNWLANCLKVQRPICALNLHGASGAGKGMLVLGLQECFRVKKANDGKVLGRFNIGLADSPIVCFDEGLPGTMPGCPSVDQTFRVLTAGGNMPLEGKGKDIIHGTLYPRLIFTSNDLDIIQGIVGNRDLNDDDVAAIESRLMSIKVPQAATNLLVAHGQFAHTKEWVGQRSQHLLAKHILSLNLAQETVKGMGRFLVEGDRGSKMMEGMRLRTEAAQVMIRLLVELIEAHQTGQRTWCLKDQGRVWTTPSAMVEYCESKNIQGMRLGVKTAGKVLRQIGTQAKGWHSPFKGAPKAKWYEIDLGVVIHEALAMGRTCEGTMRLYQERFGEDALGTLLEAEHG